MTHRRIAIAILCIVALAVRLWHLEFQSLWWDEGVSIFLAGQGVAALTIGKDFAVDLHPPGYHLLLAGWTALVGPSVLASRVLSVFAGVVTVPLAAQFTRGLLRFSRIDSTVASRAALAAGLFATISPIDVFYSQESRMYPFLPLVGAASLIATLSVARSGRWTSWLVWLGINVVGLYVFYYLAFLSVAESLILLWLGIRIFSSKANGEQLLRWLTTQIALVVAFLPWLMILSRRLGGAALALPRETEVHLTLIQFLLDNWQAFTLGFTLPPGSAVLLLLWAISAGIGALILFQKSPSAGALVLVCGILPLATAGAVLLTRPFYYPRFVLFLLVPLWALVALGVTAWPRPRVVGMFAVALLVVGNGWTWYHERTTPRMGYAPDDYRIAFATLADRIQPGDLILGGYPWQAGYARAYLWRSEPTVEYVRSPVDTGKLGNLVTPRGRAWTITYSPTQKFDPDPIEVALAERFPTSVVDEFGDTRVRLFGSPRLPNGTTMIATFGNQIGLRAPGPLPTSPAKPGESIPVVLRWGALAKPTGNYTVFVHLVGPDGKLWGQVDSPPLQGRMPTSNWVTGLDLVDRYHLTVDPKAPPGRYTVEVGVYRPENGERLPVGNALRPSPDNQIAIGTISVVGQ